MRRDITINALFYNMHTRQVEDLTGHGLSDLAQGLVRTPLPAIQTFLDDPLRVLRVIRFASRFNYDLAEDIPEAIQDERIRVRLLRCGAKLLPRLDFIHSNRNRSKSKSAKSESGKKSARCSNPGTPCARSAPFTTSICTP